MTMSEVHEGRIPDVENLVSESIPPANFIFAKYHPKSIMNVTEIHSNLSIGSIKEVVEYMELSKGPPIDKVCNC